MQHRQSKLLKYFIPPKCYLCLTNQNITHERPLCDTCIYELPWNDHCCQRCAAPSEYNIPFCRQCLTITPLYDNIVVPFIYQPPISYWIVQLKFYNNLRYNQLLGRLVSTRIYQKNRPEVIIPVPLHVQRLKQRGFNQALQLAKVISNYTHIPIDYGYIVRYKNTPQQSSLNKRARLNNLRHAFTTSKKYTYNHVAIIDDVITTGNTIHELCRTLREQGCQRIDVWCIAKGSLS